MNAGGKALKAEGRREALSQHHGGAVTVLKTSPPSVHKKRDSDGSRGEAEDN